MTPATPSNPTTTSGATQAPGAAQWVLASVLASAANFVAQAVMHAPRVVLHVAMTAAVPVVIVPKQATAPALQADWHKVKHPADAIVFFFLSFLVLNPVGVLIGVVTTSNASVFFRLIS